MATVKYTNCPNCHERKLGPYTVSTTSKHVTKGTCPHCGKRYKSNMGREESELQRIKRIGAMPDDERFQRQIQRENLRLLQALV